MGDCPSLTFSLLAKVFAKGKIFWYRLSHPDTGPVYSINVYVFIIYLIVILFGSVPVRCEGGASYNCLPLHVVANGAFVAFDLISMPSVTCLYFQARCYVRNNKTGFKSVFFRFGFHYFVSIEVFPFLSAFLVYLKTHYTRTSGDEN